MRIKVGKVDGRYKISRSEWEKIGAAAGWWQNVQKGLQKGKDIGQMTLDSLPYSPSADVFDPHPNPNIDPETGFRKDDPRNKGARDNPNQTRNESDGSKQSDESPLYENFSGDDEEAIQPNDRIEFYIGDEKHTGVVQSINTDNIQVMDEATRAWENLTPSNEFKIKKIKKE